MADRPSRLAILILLVSLFGSPRAGRAVIVLGGRDTSGTLNNSGQNSNNYVSNVGWN